MQSFIPQFSRSNSQTLIPQSFIPQIFNSLKVDRIEVKPNKDDFMIFHSKNQFFPSFTVLISWICRIGHFLRNSKIFFRCRDIKLQSGHGFRKISENVSKYRGKSMKIDPELTF